MTRLLSPTLIAVLTLGLTSLGSAKNTTEENPGAGKQKPIAEQLLGYWMVDTQKTLAAMTRAALKEAGVDKLNEKQRRKIDDEVAEMAGQMVLEFKADDAATAHQEEGAEDATYKIVKPNEATGEFELSVDHGGGNDDNTAKCLIKGDQFSFMPGDADMEIHLKRLTTPQAKQQIAKIQKGAKKPEEDKERE